MMLNVALIGAGSHCRQNHAPSLRHFVEEHPDAARLAAVCDRDEERAERAREEFGFTEAFTDIEAMFDSVAPDAVVAVVPIPAILPVTRQLLAYRVPLMIEKPLGQDMTEAHAIVESVAAAGVPVQVSFNRRHDPAVRLALEWVRDLSPIRAVHGAILRHNRTEARFQWGTASHLLDLMCYIAGPLRLAWGVAPPSRGGARLAAMTGDDEVVATAQILPCAGRMEEYVRIAGEDYCVDVWTGTPHPWRVDAYRERELQFSRRCPPDEPDYLRNGACDETAAFLANVCDGKPLSPSPSDALPSTELADALERVV